MKQQVSLRCRCGVMRGIVTGVSPEAKSRAICYCDDCQAYAQYLERTDLLHPSGGTDIFLSTPAQIQLLAGAEQLRCLRLTKRGLYRWYAGCCATPIANTFGPRLPFTTVVESFADHRADGKTRDQALGPPTHMQGKFASGPVPAHTARKLSVRFALRVVWLVLTGFFHRRTQPSPFFDARGRPRVAPKVLEPSVRASLRHRVARRPDATLHA